MRNFAGRCVVVTGAGGGLGAALVQAFLNEGASVVALDRNAQALEALQQLPCAITASDKRPLLTLACDITDAAACQKAMAQAAERFGGVDVLVNNAGISHRSAFSDTQLDVLRRVMDVNFFGAVHCTHAAMASLRARKGQIITISSVAGFSPLIGRTGYAASKHALHGFFDSLRTEVQDDGVGVLMVCPSFIDTGIDRAALGADGQPAAQGRKTTGGETQPSEVAAAILDAARANKNLLLFSSTSKAAWWLSRLWPTRYASIMKRRLRAEIFPA
jgi:NAD(P)-dependent dehydrogenase (short-subunit alcohol dehydrogenase family)